MMVNPDVDQSWGFIMMMLNTWLMIFSKWFIKSSRNASWRPLLSRGRPTTQISYSAAGKFKQTGAVPNNRPPAMLFS